MAVPRNPITIDTSDTFSTWLSNTNLAINVLKDIITDTILTHPSASAFTVGSTITQATTGATGIVQVSTTEATTLSDLGTGTWGTSNNVTQSSPTSVTVSAGDIDAVTTSHLATTGAVLTTPTITAPVIATITNNSNTLTLPTSADTLVGRATTDTLTNKTLTSPTINGGTITSVTLTSPTLTNVANLTIANAGNIGSVGDTDAMAISSGGVVTFSQRDVHSAGITVADAGQIGSASATSAISIASTGIVTFADDLIIKDGGTIGVTSAATAITIAHVADTGLTIKNTHTSGNSGIGVVLTLAIAIGSDGDITLTQDLELQHDGAILSFGTNDDVTITHVADTGLIIKNTHTSGNSGVGVVLTLQTGDTDIADGNILGQIKFQAPDEGSGAADQDLVAAGIAARSEGDFADDNNATELVFNTGASEDASIGASGGDMILSSGGDLILSAGDAKLQHDGAILYFGANDDTYLEHVHNDGLILKNVGSAGATTLCIQTSNTTVTDGDILGALEFQAPNETGTDAITVSATISARAEGTFDATNNPTELVFNTGLSESAHADTTNGKMILSSAGALSANTFKMWGAVNPTPVDFGVVNNSTGHQNAIAGLGTGYGECAAGGRMVATYPTGGELAITFTNAGSYLVCAQMGNAGMGGNDVTNVELHNILDSETTATVVDLGFSGNADDRIFALGALAGLGGANMAGTGWYSVVATAGQKVQFNPRAEFTTSDDGEDINQKIFTAYMVWG